MTKIDIALGIHALVSALGWDGAEWFLLQVIKEQKTIIEHFKIMDSYRRSRLS